MAKSTPKPWPQAPHLHFVKTSRDSDSTTSLGIQWRSFSDEVFLIFILNLLWTILFMSILSSLPDHTRHEPWIQPWRVISRIYCDLCIQIFTSVLCTKFAFLSKHSAKYALSTGTSKAPVKQFGKLHCVCAGHICRDLLHLPLENPQTCLLFAARLIVQRLPYT